MLSSLSRFFSHDSSNTTKITLKEVKEFQNNYKVFDEKSSLSFKVSCIKDNINPNYEKGLKAELFSLLKDNQIIAGYIYVGFKIEIIDSEISKLCFSSNDISIIIQNNSFSFESITLKDFLLNILFPEYKILFLGVDIGKALAYLFDDGVSKFSLKINGIIDLAPTFDVNNGKRCREEFKLRYPVYKIDFDKNHNFGTDGEIEIIKNDIITSDLSYQIKNLSIDSWIHYALGRYHYGNIAPKTKYILSTRDIDATFCYNQSIGLKEIYKQILAMEDLKTEKNIKVQNMMIPYLQHGKNDSNYSFKVNCASYANHIREGSLITIKIVSPKGSRNGVIFKASADEVTGKIAQLTIITPKTNVKISYDNSVDRFMYNKILQDPAKLIVEFWKIEDDQCGDFVPIDRQTKVNRSKNLIQVRLFTKESGIDIQSQQVLNTMQKFFSLHYSLEEVDYSKNTKNLLANRKMLLPFSLLMGKPIDNTVNLTTHELESIEVHNEYLNEEQFNALSNTYKNKVSVIEGPPGTGKTRTIAAIADVAMAINRRLLIVAPANAASRRILESIVATGFDDVCLIVSQEYFYEWHEKSYESSLSNFVHTKSCFDDEQDFRNNKTTTSKDREENDFKARNKNPHRGKWTELAKREGKVDVKDKPRVVIATYGTISSKVGNKKSRWGKEVENLLGYESIDMIIVDETSQLWSGYSIGLMCQFQSLKNIVLVGDDKQLAPFGEDRIKNFKSLFDVALKNIDIPKTLLRVTFRLPLAVASIISDKIYDRQLQVKRNILSDSSFQNRIKYILTIIKNSFGNLGLATSQLLERFVDENKEVNVFNSLAWIHRACNSHMNDENKSIGNEEEAELLTTIAGFLLSAINKENNRNKMNNSDFKRITLVILTPYLEQKSLLERCLTKTLNKLKFMNFEYSQLVYWVQSSLVVNTIDSFQGQEADIVLISTVRSVGQEGMGFARDNKRANVMLSRASQLLIIIGDAQNLTTKLSMSTDRLLPSMAFWTSENNAMFQIINGSLTYFKLAADPEYNTNIKSPVTKTKLIKELKEDKMIIRIQKTPVKTTELHILFSKLLRNLLIQNNNCMSLSQIGPFIDKDNRPEQSLIKSVKDLDPKEGFVLIREGESWIVKLYDKKNITKKIDYQARILVSILKKSPTKQYHVETIKSYTENDSNYLRNDQKRVIKKIANAKGGLKLFCENYPELFSYYKGIVMLI